MPSLNKTKGPKILTLILMMFSLNTIYVLPYLMYTYYTPLQEAMGLVGKDAAYGHLLNIYGIANVILYLPGGWLADKFDAKKMLVFSMVSTGVLGLLEATWPSYTMLMLIYIGWAFTTVLTYWSASIKCINVISDPDEQGGMFGSLEAGRGIVGLVCTTLFVGIYTAFSANSKLAMGGVVIACSIIMILVGIALAFMMPKTSSANTTNATIGGSLKAMGKAFALPITYLLSGMIFAACIAQALNSYYAPYLQNILGMDVKYTVIFSNYNRTVCTVIGAAAAAVLATKVHSSSKVLIGAGISLVASLTIILLMPSTAAFMWPLLIIVVLATLSYVFFRALYYAVIDELGTDKNMVGSVIGIASLIGFIPDTFFTSVCGAWLEADPVGGYHKIFLAGAAAAVLGLVCAVISNILVEKKRAAAK